MYHHNIVIEVKERLHCSRDDANKALTAVFAALTVCLSGGTNIKVKDFGTFRVRLRMSKSVPGKGTPYIFFSPEKAIIRSLQKMLDEAETSSSPESPPPVLGLGQPQLSESERLQRLDTLYKRGAGSSQ